jgi:IS30 family transposase
MIIGENLGVAKYQEIAEALEADFYFANPYHSWERDSTSIPMD